MIISKNGNISMYENDFEREAGKRYSQIKSRTKNAKHSIEKWDLKDFISWYEEQAKIGVCYYCKSTTDEIRRFRLTHKSKRDKQRGGKLEVERKKADGSYSRSNCALICYYCNNAKSDIFSEAEFRGKSNKPSYIALAIGDAIRRGAFKARL